MHTTHLNPLRGLWACALLLILAVLSACGGGGGGAAPSVIASLPPSAASQSDSNVAIITVESGPRNNVNIPYVSVTLCAPGNTINCKTIDHVLLDTGSTGLRVFSSALASAPALTLPPHTVGSSSTISECAQFLNAMAWGSVKVADVLIGSKTALSIPVQVMETSTAPTTCGGLPLMAPPSLSASSSLSPLSANGILGVSQFINDGQTYFNCANPTTSACSFRPTSAQQVQNPVSRFTTDNNGVVIQMPSISAAGATVANGYLIFGVGTQANNSLGSANVVPLNRLGYFTTTYNGTAYTSSFMDSGSNGLYFDDASISTACSTAASGFYCPNGGLTLPADIDLGGGATARVNFSVGNADTLLQGNRYAFNNLGGTMSAGMFDWGLPFFFGRSVYTVMEGKTVNGRTGPLYAFTN